MANFTSVVYNKAAGTVSFGTGRSWDEIYAILQQSNVTVAGGRVPGVGKFIAFSLKYYLS